MVNRLKNKKAFTLVEMMIAIGLFTLIVSISLGAILNIFDANRRNQSSKTVVDNLNFSIENMARTVRFGDHYHCGSGGDPENPQNCPNGDDFLAVQFEGNTVVYRKCGNEIRKSENGDEDCSEDTMLPITSSDTVIQYLKFYVFGANENPPAVSQPYVIAVIKGYVGNKLTAQSSFNIETVMSQRKLDI